MKKAISVDSVTTFINIVEKDCEEVISKIIVLKTRLSKKAISEASIMHDLDEILKIIRR